MKSIFEVVKVFDMEPFESGDGGLHRFRLEVCELNAHLFRGTVYRFETYRVQPSFPQHEGQLPEWQSDELVMVLDENQDWTSLRGNSVAEVVNKFQEALAKCFEGRRMG